MIIATWILPNLAKQEDNESSNTPRRTIDENHFTEVFYGDQSSRVLENIQQNFRDSEEKETFFSLDSDKFRHYCRFGKVFARFFLG